MIEAAERSGQLKPGGTLVEASAGKTFLLLFADSGQGYLSVEGLFPV
jgi:hypothetical protein